MVYHLRELSRRRARDGAPEAEGWKHGVIGAVLARGPKTDKKKWMDKKTVCWESRSMFL